MVSEKQKQILLKNGYTEKAIVEMNYQQVSLAIGDILAGGKKPSEPVKQAVMAPKGEFKAHLSIEQVRMNALEIALKLEPNMNLESLKKVAEDIELWMTR